MLRQYNFPCCISEFVIAPSQPQVRGNSPSSQSYHCINFQASKNNLWSPVFHLGHQGKQEAKKHTRIQTAWAEITSAKALNLLLITVTTFSFSYINYQTHSYLLLFPDYSCPVHILAHLEVNCQSSSYPSLCVVTYKDDTCP